MKACIDPRRAIYQNVIEQRRDTFYNEFNLLPRYVCGGGYLFDTSNETVSFFVIPDGRLFSPAPPLYYIQKIVNYFIFQPHNHVQIIQPEIYVYQHDPRAEVRKRDSEIGGYRRFFPPPLFP